MGHKGRSRGCPLAVSEGERAVADGRDNEGERPADRKANNTSDTLNEHSKSGASLALVVVRVLHANAM